MSDYFYTLVNQLHEHHMLSDPPYVHGLLTGFATTRTAILRSYAWKSQGNARFQNNSGKS